MLSYDGHKAQSIYTFIRITFVVESMMRGKYHGFLVIEMQIGSNKAKFIILMAAGTTMIATYVLSFMFFP